MSKELICLNGEWDFMPVYGARSSLNLPQEIHFEYEKICVPSSWRYVTPEGMSFCKSDFGIIDDFEPFNMFDYPKEWSMAETGVYRKIFSIPDRILEELIFLRFDGIMQQSRSYLNNNIVAEWNEAFLPLKVDVTKYIKSDGMENELIVICSSFDEIQMKTGETKTLGLIGSWFGHLGRGIWQDVFIERTSLTFIADVFIKTSVINSCIEVEVEIENIQDDTQEINLLIDIFDELGIVLALRPQQIKIDSNSKRTIKISEQWANPKLWSFETPFLYNAQIVLQAVSGKLDRKTIAFGFREIWTEGHKFILNGIRINMRGDSWHFQGAIQQTKEYAINWFNMCKEKGLNFVRLHAEPHPEYYLEAADEVGILIIDETAIYGSGKTMDAGNPVFINRCKEHIQRLVKRDRNHPSIIMWSLQNEMRWVDGRDEFKQHIPEMIKIIKKLDDSRPIIIEGDNRLILKKDTEVESYHYNIDGTIAQWDKEKPLVFGEHGGWWYICPQNFSAYSGLKAYLSWENSSIGAALKEKLYVEGARGSEVSGITSFNFAHYLMKSMPNEDISLEWKELNSPGCKPKFIRKHSLTINNGYLKNYPKYLPNIAMAVLQEAYKAVTIIPAEYNSFFFDDCIIERSFDIYNDTLESHKAKVEFCVSLLGGQEVYKETFLFIQGPGEREKIKISFISPKCIDKSILLLDSVLYHQNQEMFKLQKSYTICSASLKQKNIEVANKQLAFWGSDKDYATIKELIPSCKRLLNLSVINNKVFNTVIIGSHVNSYAETFHKCIEQYIENGGTLVVLEQSKFAMGDLTLFKQAFFSAQINDSSHKILEGLSEEDFRFWKPNVNEEYPEAIIEDCYKKPTVGDVEFILDASAGDFGDGGNLWSPLFVYKYKKGTIIFNQLELMPNYSNIPQACILLRNILKYAVTVEPRVQYETAVLFDLDERNLDFIKMTGLNFHKVKPEERYAGYKNLIIDSNSFKEDKIEKLYAFANSGGNVLVLPVDTDDQVYLEKLMQCKVEITKAPVYQLKKHVEHKLTSGISIYDTFRYEKVNFSPRMVVNEVICENSIIVQGGQCLLESNNGTPWYDYYVRDIADEYARIALIDINRINKKEDLPYLVEKQVGEGRFILSQISTDVSFEKNVRVYSRLFANMGAGLAKDFFSYSKGDRDYSMEYLMTINLKDHKDIITAEAYFSDKEYSLNNLGEGIYGWMKKVEKDTEEGFINILGSRGTRCFTTCFVNFVRDKSLEEPQPDSISCKLDIAANCSFKLWINGDLVKEYLNKQQETECIMVNDIRLVKGLNRFFLIGKCDYEDIKIRPVFKAADGSYLDCLQYTLTLDEVDPK